MQYYADMQPYYVDVRLIIPGIIAVLVYYIIYKPFMVMPTVKFA